MEIEGILVEENLIKDENERKRLEEKGYKIVKSKQNENLVHIFNEDKTFLTCNKDETIFRISLLNSTLCRIILTDKLTTVILFAGKRVQSYSFRISRNESLRAIRTILMKSTSFLEFVEKYLSYLNENNDDKVIEWLREKIVKKKE